MNFENNTKALYLDEYLEIVLPGFNVITVPNPHLPNYLRRLFDIIIMNALVYSRQY